MPGFADPAYLFHQISASGGLALDFVNWDVVFGYLETQGALVAPPSTWQALLAVLAENPVFLVLAAMLVQTGGSGPIIFPKENCPKGTNFWDPTQSPGKDWVWKGNGPPGSGNGSWYNTVTKEVLYPDLQHPPGIPPHWDYRDPTGQWWRCYADGTFEKKK